jgi:hypothetical protein
VIAYFDMFSGVSGDMILGSLLDAGLEREALLESLRGLPIGSFDLRVERVRRGALAATLAAWRFEDTARHRHLPQIEALIGEAGFPPEVARRSVDVFRRLAEAEARVHGIAPEEVHFHEVGALDAVLDVCGAVAGLRLLGVDRVAASPFRTGTGYVRTEHGRLPVPAPAVAFLVQGWRLEPLDVQAELTTPTGAALVTTLAEPPGGPPELTVARTGYGAGSRDESDPPNCLRVMLGEAVERGAGPGQLERLVTLETQIDDMNPQLYGWLEEQLFAAGARDVFCTAIAMKKGRPGTLVTCLADERTAATLTDVLFRETTTIGVRSWIVQRRALERSLESVATSLGPVRVKRVLGADGRTELRPEYEDCRRIAAARRQPLREVLARVAAEAAAGVAESRRIE